MTLKEPPRYAVNCCCCDCRQKLEWCIAQGCPLTAPTNPLKLEYFSNAILDLKHSENLKSYKLREDGGSTFAVAECCMSMMMIDHVAYAGNLIMVPVDGVKLKFEDPVESLIQIFCDDWAKKPGAGELPPFDGPSLANFSPEEVAKVPPELDIPAKFMKPHGREEGDKSLQDFIKDVEILGLEEYAPIISI